MKVWNLYSACRFAAARHYRPKLLAQLGAAHHRRFLWSAAKPHSQGRLCPFHEIGVRTMVGAGSSASCYKQIKPAK